MQINLLPFNISLLTLNSENIKGLAPIQVLDIFTASTKNFHPNGLFSTEIFGKVGDERRSRTFAFIDLKVKVFHPIIFKALCDLKQLYGEILSSRSYAIWNEETKDFEKCSPSEGDTGFHYFLQHFEELQFERRNSDRRDFNIRVIEKYRDNCLMDKLLVIPAGIRDYEVNEQGKPSEDEINDIYRKAFSYANLISPTVLKLNPDSIDLVRFNIQLQVSAVYDYIKNMLEGKKKLILGKWASRRINHSTRNVFTSLNDTVNELNSPLAVSTSQTVVGLYQYLKAIMPLALHQIRNGFLSKVFTGPNVPAILVNKKTLKKEMVHVKSSFYDDWMTDEGLEKVITQFGEEDLRHMVLDYGNYYLGLLYRGPDNTFKIIQDIDEIPEGRSKKDVQPLTFTELLYLSVYENSDKIPGFVTRYPVIAFGGIYPTYTYLKTTTNAETRRPLNDSWEIDMRDSKLAKQFPIKNEAFMNSLSVSSKHLARLGADFDGDTGSYIALWSDESKIEVNRVLNSRTFYVNAENKMNFSASTDTIDYVLASMTG